MVVVGVGALAGAEDVAARPVAEVLFAQDAAQRPGERYYAPPGAALREDDRAAGVEALFDADDAGAEVDVLPFEAAQLALPESGVEGGRPDGEERPGEACEELSAASRFGGSRGSASRAGRSMSVHGFTAITPSRTARR